MKPSRNAPCPCGSTLKHKKCCGRAEFFNQAQAEAKAEQARLHAEWQRKHEEWLAKQKEAKKYGTTVEPRMGTVHAAALIASALSASMHRKIKPW